MKTYPCLDQNAPTKQVDFADQKLTPSEFALLTNHFDGWYSVTHPDR